MEIFEQDTFWEKPIAHIQSLLLTGNSCSVGFSGGKDSSCVLILFLEAVKRLVEDGHQNIPTSVVLHSNTRRDMPLIASYAEWSLTQIEVYCAIHKLPVQVHQVEPSISGRFTWSCLGRGKLPRWPGASRDCAIDEKINPQKKLVTKLERELGTTFVALLGSRESESASRKESMKKYKMDELTVVQADDGKHTFAPIADWELDQVFEFLIGCSHTDVRPPRIFETYTRDFEDMLDLYRSANGGQCAAITGDSSSSSRAACGSRFGCSWCTVSGERDKSLESMLEEDSERFGFMKPFVAFRRYLLAIRWDMQKRDWRGRTVQNGRLKVTPNYFSPQTKRELLRYLLTIDAMEKERAKKHEEAYYNGTIEQTEYNYLLTQPMFQNIDMSDLLVIDFAWSLSRDFREASPAARDWIEIHDLGYRYHVPQIDSHERVKVPKDRWFDVSASLDESLVGIKGFIPVDGKMQELDIEYSDELTVKPGAGLSYLTAIRERYFELELVDPSEICRAALHHNWVTMRQHDVERYEKIALRNDYIYKLYAQERPMKVNEDGDDVLMTINEFLTEHSMPDEEHKALLKEEEKAQIANDYKDDLFGVESVYLAIDERDDENVTHSTHKLSKVKGTTNVSDYAIAASQVSLF